MPHFSGKFIRNKNITRGQRIINSPSTGKEYAVYFTDNENFFDEFNAKANVARLVISKGKHSVTSKSLSHKWWISPEVNKRTVKHTTQQGIRTILHPALSS